MADGNYTVGGIAYDKENDRLVTKQTTTCVSILDNAYKGIKDIEIYASSLTGQGIGYFHNYIYLPYAELASENSYQSAYYNTAEICSALIYIYDLEGNFIKTLYIPGKNIDYGEIESISFDENGTMYIGVYGMNYNNSTTKKSAINFYTVNKYTDADTGKLIDFKPNTDSISVKTNPTKTKYTVGENLNLSGGKITVKYKERIVSWDNNLNRTVTDPKVITKTIDIGAKGVSVTGYDKNKIGTQTLTVKYDGKATTFNVTVNPKIEVTFEKNDGTSETWNQTFVYGDSGNRFGYKNGSIWPGYTYNENKFLGWERTGYTLLGWSTNANTTSAEYSIYDTVSDSWISQNAPSITLYAVWKEKTAILSYDANEHGTAPSQVIMKYTEETNAAPAISATGYTFEGWNTKADGSGTKYAAGAQVKAANIVPNTTTLYAQWTANAITFENQTITKTYSTREQVLNVKSVTDGSGEYTYAKKSGESDITVSTEGKITIPAKKNVGTYKIVITATDSISNSTEDATYTIKINKATPTITLSEISAEINYNKTGTFKAKPSVAGVLTATSENIEQVDITEGASNIAEANTDYTIGYIGAGYTTNVTTITVKLEPTDTTNYNNSTAIFSVTKVNKISMGKPVVSIDTEGNITWSTVTGATGYEISFDNKTWETATSGSKTIDTNSTGNKTAYVRAVTTNKNYTTPSKAGSKTVSIYNLTINKGTGISKVTGEGNYIEGKEITIEATTGTGYTWLKWIKTKGTEPADIMSNKTTLIITEDTVLTAEATANEITFENQTITKTYSTREQVLNVKSVTDGSGEYTYAKKSGESDITVSTEGKITIPAKKNVGTYKIVITATDSISNSTEDATYTIKINKATPTITLSEISAEINYNKTGTFKAKPSVAGVLTATSENIEQVDITEGASNIAEANTDYTIGYIGAGYTTNVTTITVKLEPTDTTNYNNSTAIFSVTKVNKISMGKPVVSIDTEGNITWSTVTGATGYEISFDNKTWETATSGSKTIDTNSTGNKTAYVRAVTTNKNYTTPSKAGSKTVSIYNLTINKGTGISKVTGEGNYIEGKEITIEATTGTGYTWLKWIKTKGTEPADIMSNKTTLIITEDTVLTAEATANELAFKDQTITKTFSSDEQIEKNAIKVASNGSGEYSYNITAGNNEGNFNISGRDLVIKGNTKEGTYKLVVEAKDINTKKTKTATYTIIITKMIEIKEYIIENGVLTNVISETTVTNFKNNIITGNQVSIKIVNKDNIELKETEIVKTGDKLQVIVNNIITEYPIIITGDVDGDGYINIKDILTINKHRLNKVKLTDVYFIAGDIDKNGEADIRDILQINKYRLKKISSL